MGNQCSRQEALTCMAGLELAACCNLATMSVLGDCSMAASSLPGGPVSDTDTPSSMQESVPSVIMSVLGAAAWRPAHSRIAL